MSEADEARRFVIQRHQSKSLHYDFRLERVGVFVSWAVPKGLPEVSGVQCLTLSVPDHALSFGDFEGVIPAGEPGTGEIQVWDRGTYDHHAWSDERIEVTLHGTRYCGRYVLLRFRRKGEREWHLSKLLD